MAPFRSCKVKDVGHNLRPRTRKIDYTEYDLITEIFIDCKSKITKRQRSVETRRIKKETSGPNNVLTHPTTNIKLRTKNKSSSTFEDKENIEDDARESEEDELDSSRSSTNIKSSMKTKYKIIIGSPSHSIESGFYSDGQAGKCKNHNNSTTMSNKENQKNKNTDKPSCSSQDTSRRRRRNNNDQDYFPQIPHNELKNKSTKKKETVRNLRPRLKKIDYSDFYLTPEIVNDCMGKISKRPLSDEKKQSKKKYSSPDILIAKMQIKSESSTFDNDEDNENITDDAIVEDRFNSSPIRNIQSPIDVKKKILRSPNEIIESGFNSDSHTDTYLIHSDSTIRPNPDYTNLSISPNKSNNNNNTINIIKRDCITIKHEIPNDTNTDEPSTTMSKSTERDDICRIPHQDEKSGNTNSMAVVRNLRPRLRKIDYSDNYVTPVIINDCKETKSRSVVEKRIKKEKSDSSILSPSANIHLKNNIKITSTFENNIIMENIDVSNEGEKENGFNSSMSSTSIKSPIKMKNKIIISSPSHSIESGFYSDGHADQCLNPSNSIATSACSTNNTNNEKSCTSLKYKVTSDKNANNESARTRSKSTEGDDVHQISTRSTTTTLDQNNNQVVWIKPNNATFLNLSKNLAQYLLPLKRYSLPKDLIRSLALKMAEKMRIYPQKFKASNHWIQTFKKRHFNGSSAFTIGPVVRRILDIPLIESKIIVQKLYFDEVGQPCRTTVQPNSKTKEIQNSQCTLTFTKMETVRTPPKQRIVSILQQQSSFGPSNGLQEKLVPKKLSSGISNSRSEMFRHNETAFKNNHIDPYLTLTKVDTSTAARKSMMSSSLSSSAVLRLLKRENGSLDNLKRELGIKTLPSVCVTIERLSESQLSKYKIPAFLSSAALTPKSSTIALTPERRRGRPAKTSTKPTIPYSGKQWEKIFPILLRQNSCHFRELNENNDSSREAVKRKSSTTNPEENFSAQKFKTAEMQQPIANFCDMSSNAQFDVKPIASFSSLTSSNENGNCDSDVVCEGKYGCSQLSSTAIADDDNFCEIVLEDESANSQLLPKILESDDNFWITVLDDKDESQSLSETFETDEIFCENIFDASPDTLLQDQEPASKHKALLEEVMHANTSMDDCIPNEDEVVPLDEISPSLPPLAVTDHFNFVPSDSVVLLPNSNSSHASYSPFYSSVNCSDTDRQENSSFSTLDLDESFKLALTLSIWDEYNELNVEC